MPPKFRTLTKCHTEKWRIRRIIKNTTLIGTEALLCVEQRRLFTSYIRHFLFKVFISKLSGSCMLHLFRSLNRRHLPDIMFSSVLVEPPCALQLRALVFHSIFWKNQVFCRLSTTSFHGRVRIWKILLSREKSIF